MKAMYVTMKQALKRNRKMGIFFLGLAFIGICAGAVFFSFIDGLDQELVKEYMQGFSSHLKEATFSYQDLFCNQFLSEIGFSFLLFVLGFTMIGLPITSFLYFLKSFILGFSIVSFLYSLKWMGFVFATIYLFPSFCNLFLYFLFLLSATKLSKTFFRLLFTKEEVSIKKPLRQYVFLYGILLVLLTFTTFLETVCFPFFYHLVF